MRKTAGRILIAALAIIAGAMLLSHLRLPCRDTVYRMSNPRAFLREEERLAPDWPDGPVAVNTAGLEELDTLPGIGPVLAQRIVDERTQNGPFHYPEDLLAVSGIGEKTLQKLREQISINK